MARWVPESLGRWHLKSAWKSLAAKESIPPEFARLMQDMANDVSWAKFLWQLQAVARWNRHRSDFDGKGFAVHQIHGMQDRLIKVPPVEDATLLLKEAHLIHMSATEQVNRWIESILRNADLVADRHPLHEIVIYEICGVQ